MNRSWDIQERGAQSPLFVCFTALFWNVRPRAAQKCNHIIIGQGHVCVHGRNCLTLREHERVVLHAYVKN